MSQQPQSTSPQRAVNPAAKPVPYPMSAPNTQDLLGKHTPQRIPRWLERSELFVRSMLLMFIGFVIWIAPWSGKLLWFLPRARFLWDDNPLILYFPLVAHYAANGAVCGLVSGLGLLSFWISLVGIFRHWDG
jgi:hypothetical protein